MRDWVPLVVAICALLAGGYGAQASMRATKVNQEANQIKWLQEARTESAAAKKDADAATDAAASARRELNQTKIETAEVRDLVEELTRWILRVVDWSHDTTVDGPELRRLINGGPPSLREKTRPAKELP